jgi:hypothetical protein
LNKYKPNHTNAEHIIVTTAAVLPHSTLERGKFREPKELTEGGAAEAESHHHHHNGSVWSKEVVEAKHTIAREAHEATASPAAAEAAATPPLALIA